MAKRTAGSKTKTPSPAREAGAARFPNLPNLRSLSDVADQLKVNYIKAKDLAAAGPFVLLSAAPRTKHVPGKAPVEEMAFEVALAGGEIFYYTPESNAIRSRMADALKAGPIGPLTLIQGPAKPGMNRPWMFADEAGNPAY